MKKRKRTYKATVEYVIYKRLSFLGKRCDDEWDGGFTSQRQAVGILRKKYAGGDFYIVKVTRQRIS